MTKLEHALALAGEGFHVFPIAPGEKAPPLIKNFPENASRDTDEITEWWEEWPTANIGISTSRYGDDEALLVVDVDKKGEKDGDLALLQMELFDRNPVISLDRALSHHTGLMPQSMPLSPPPPTGSSPDVDRLDLLLEQTKSIQADLRKLLSPRAQEPERSPTFQTAPPWQSTDKGAMTPLIKSPPESKISG